MARSGRLKRFLSSLTWRMALGMLAIHVVLIPLLFGGVLYIVKQGQQDQFINHARADASLFAEHIGALLGNAHLQGVLDEAAMNGRIVYADVLDVQNRTLAQVDATGGRATFKEDFFFGQHDDHVYFISLPLLDRSGNPQGTVQIGYDETTTQEQIILAYRRGIYLALAYLLLTMALVGFVGPAITKPLKQLQEASRKIAHGHFAEQLHVGSHIAELHDLADDLNIMRTELVKQADSLQHQALHDGLTGLPNRTLLRDRLQQAMYVADRTRQTLALMLMDLDHFKEVNDTLGHAAGDIILQQVAMRLRHATRESDTVARLGGDEFALILLTESEDDVIKATRSLVETIREPIMVEGKSLRIGESIGIALYQKHGTDFDILLRKADVAMYESKRARSSFTMYETALDRNSLSQLVLSGELEKALKQREFMLHFQPKIDVKTGEVRSVEALTRWQHPQRGLISPEEFIPLAEKTGFIGALTEWILNESLRQANVWKDMGIHVNIAVNLSAHCLQDLRFTDNVLAALKTHHASPSNLTLELTESAIMSDPIRANEIFARLQAIGVRLSIDDFGTGYSSLTHLKKLPLDEIKIDKSFVMDMLQDDANAAIVQTMISLAHNLDIMVVAEGVEQEEAFDLLKQMGCDILQGYYISKPLMAEQFELWSPQPFLFRLKKIAFGSKK